MEYYTTAELAKRWGITQRRVAIYCKEGRFEGAILKGRTWLIPGDVEKPQDPRRIKKNNEELRNSIDDWKTNLEEAFARANSMFGLNLTVVFPYLEHLEKVEDVESEEDKASAESDSKPRKGLKKWLH